jgi:hypothetical protein
MKQLTYLFGMASIAILANSTPGLAQIAGGNDNGSGKEAISAPLAGNRQTVYAPQSQTAVNQFSQALTANSVGDAATFDVINGSSPATLVAALLPSGVATDGATGKAAVNLATTIQGLRAGNGNIDAVKLNASVVAYNEYVKALVGEVSADKAISGAPNGQKAVQGLLTQLIRVANQAAVK